MAYLEASLVVVFLVLMIIFALPYPRRLSYRIHPTLSFVTYRQ